MMVHVGVKVRDLLDLPQSVRKGDFVLSLADGIRRADETVRSYAITPSLVHCFDTALGVIGSALTSRRSQAVYLHGSFGSGKSHFMAMLELLLDGHAAAWARTEMHPLRSKQAWVGQKKVLRLPMHMIGADSLEAKVFSTYVDYVRLHHPEAPLPPLFRDEALFVDARGLRSTLGDDAFFSKLNSGIPAASGWGALGERWDASRFDAAVASIDPGVRGTLFSTLGKTFFSSATLGGQGYLDIDRGLGALSRHAAVLGYDAVVLFLDELILWLAGHFSNLDFVQREAQKIAKLKEAQDEQRDVPIASFIARQRDLSELIGANALGAEQTTLRDSLAWSGGRFETIRIEDRNLPAVVERRVVRSRDEQARAALGEGFTAMKRRLDNGTWGTLLGSAAGEAEFRKIYPFSPAVLEVLVAVSDCLQRERTAIKILMELLVDHLLELESGGVVTVGDVFDVVAGGEDPFDHVLKDRFDRAKAVYREQLLPLIRAAQGTASRERCQRLRDEHPAHLGCSGCAEAACRNDNRLAKTILLAALVPQAEPFRELTVRRLVQLNPGAVPTPIPGGEVQMAAERLRGWASHLGQLRVGEQDDPQVSLRLEGVDLKPILDSASEVDSLAARRRALQRIIFEALELDTSIGSVVQTTMEWRGTKRPGQVRFTNVREATEAVLRCPAEAEWQVLIDYPFDEPGYTPEDDLSRIERHRDSHSGETNSTFIWLPTFFSDALERELGRLVTIEHVLGGENSNRFVGHLRPEDQAHARHDLDSLAGATRSKIRLALAQAYGLSIVTQPELLDSTRGVEDHVVSLEVGLDPRPLLAPTFGKALQQLAERLLEHKHPHHPQFETLATTGKLEKIREFLEKLLGAADRRQAVTPPVRKELQELASPLGLVTLGETVAVLDETRLREIDRERERLGKEPPTVEDIRFCLDPHETKGLTDEVADLLVAVYAAWSGRELERNGHALDQTKLGKIPVDAELVRPDLPSEAEWQAALTLAGYVFGIAMPGRALNLRNVNDFSAKVSEKIADARRDVLALPDILQERIQHWCPGGAPAPRLTTAHSAARLVQVLQDSKPADLVRQLAAFVPETSPQALGKSISTCRPVKVDLSDASLWLNFDQLVGLRNDPELGERASAVLDRLATILVADELIQGIATVRTELVPQLSALLRRPAKPTVPQPVIEPVPPQVVPPPEIKPELPGVSQPLMSFSEEATSSEEVEKVVETLLDRVRAEYARAELPKGGRLKVELIIHKVAGEK